MTALRTDVDGAAAAPLGTPVLAVEGLSVSFGPGVRVVDDVSFSIGRGEVLGLVGESGSGKTMTAMAILGLARAKGATVDARSIRLDGAELLGLSEARWSDIRGREVGMVFQQPTRCLNPAYTVGQQISEVIRRHTGASRKEAAKEAVRLLDRVHIADAARRAGEYPHTFSGGMCQRVMIAMALACDPKLLIADEPTTALDVTVQARVLDLLRELHQEVGAAVLFITHDLGVVAEMCDRVAVMYAGEVVEVSATARLFRDPVHPYTRGLISSVPRVGSTKQLEAIPGTVPSASDLPPGCRFHPRCAHAVPGRCDVEVPALARAADDHEVRCVRAGELTGRR